MNENTTLFAAAIFVMGNLQSQVGFSALIEELGSKTEDIIKIVMPSYGKETSCGTSQGIDYYMYGRCKLLTRIDKNAIQTLATILSREDPDIIHLCGTEYLYSTEAIRAASIMGMEKRVLLVIQGLCSQIVKHYYDTIPLPYRYMFTVRDLLRLDNIFFQRRKMKQRGNNEIKAGQSGALYIRSD